MSRACSQIESVGIHWGLPLIEQIHDFLYILCLHPFGVAIATAPALSRHLSIERVARLKPATRGIHRYALAKKNPNPFGLRSIFGGGGGN
ncbi:hypothetical protein ACMAY4_10915 [Porticoccaceae bacterium nBUS_17]